MVITVFMLIFIALLILTGAYLLWSQRHGQFIIFNFETNPKVKNLFVFTSIGLFIVAAIGIFILFTLSREYNFITLILGSIIVMIFSLSFLKLNA